MLPWAKIFHPSLLARQWIRRQPDWSLQTKLDLDWFPFPQYAYTLNLAVRQARQLGHDRISAVVFGIGNGDGLAALETIAAALEAECGIGIDLFGFWADAPDPPTDPRDLPYLRHPAPDRLAAEAKVKRSTLLPGALDTALPGFLDALTPAPTGLIVIDLLRYTTACQALQLLEADPGSRLPRTFVCLQNTVGDDDALHGPHAGERLAIGTFTRAHPRCPIAPIAGLRDKRVFPSAWCDSVYVAHDLDHPRYAEGPPTAPSDATGAGRGDAQTVPPPTHPPTP